MHSKYATKHLVEAVRKECAKFTFPDEDRPELYQALRLYDDTVAVQASMTERELFEEEAFKQRFLSSIVKTKPGEFGPVGIRFMSKSCPSKDEFIRKNEDGSYVDEGLNYAWWAWQTAREVK